MKKEMSRKQKINFVRKLTMELAPLILNIDKALPITRLDSYKLYDLLVNLEMDCEKELFDEI